VVDYEIDPASLSINGESQLNVSAAVRNIGFYSFSENVTDWGKDIYHQEVLEIPPLISINTE